MADKYKELVAQLLEKAGIEIKGHLGYPGHVPTRALSSSGRAPHLQ